jgi:hypothetical protein
MFVIILYFIYFYYYLSSRIGHDLVHEQRYLDKDRSFITLTSSIRLCYVLCFKAPNVVSICWQIASRSYMSLYMAFSRKYGTVWYHWASSKLWHLTTLPFVNFRKIDWHALESARVLSQLVRLAVCLARGADFASTPTHDQLADIFTKPLDQATFTHFRWELGVCLISWVGCVGAPLYHMYSFRLCICCIWHGIRNMMYRHPCILDCMHFVSYASVRKNFSHIHCSPWNEIYVFVILFGKLWLVWLSSW